MKKVKSILIILVVVALLFACVFVTRQIIHYVEARAKFNAMLSPGGYGTFGYSFPYFTVLHVAFLITASVLLLVKQNKKPWIVTLLVYFALQVIGFVVLLGFDWLVADRNDYAITFIVAIIQGVIGAIGLIVSIAALRKAANKSQDASKIPLS